MMYFRFILDSSISTECGNGTSGLPGSAILVYRHVRSYRGRGHALELLTGCCRIGDVRKMRTRYGRYAVVSFEGDSIFSIDTGSDVSLARKVTSDGATFTSCRYWIDGSKMLFARTAVLSPLIDAIRDSGVIVMTWQLADSRRMDDTCLERYFSESLVSGMSLRGLRDRPDELFSYMCFRLDRIKVALLSSVLTIVLVSSVLAWFLNTRTAELSGDLESLRRQSGAAMETEKDLEAVISELGPVVLPPASYVMDRFAVLRPDGLLYTEVRITGKIMEVKGNIEDPSALVRLTESVQAEEYVEDCSILSMRRGRNGILSFTLRIVRK